MRAVPAFDKRCSSATLRLGRSPGSGRGSTRRTYTVGNILKPGYMRAPVEPRSNISLRLTLLTGFAGNPEQLSAP